MLELRDVITNGEDVNTERFKPYKQYMGGFTVLDRVIFNGKNPEARGTPGGHRNVSHSPTLSHVARTA